VTKASPEVFVGLDLGTSGLKGLALEESGGMVASARCDYPTRRASPGRAEQTPGDWTSAVRRVIERLANAAPADRWSAIALSGMIPTLVTLDRDRHPVGSALIWEDARAARQASDIRSTVGSDRLYQLVGQWVDGR